MEGPRLYSVGELGEMIVGELDYRNNIVLDANIYSFNLYNAEQILHNTIRPLGRNIKSKQGAKLDSSKEIVERSEKILVRLKKEIEEILEEAKHQQDLEERRKQLGYSMDD